MLRWRKNKRETGLRAVVANPKRGSRLFDREGNDYASVSPLGGDWRTPFQGWYWVAFKHDWMPSKNTCYAPVPTETEAKKQAAAYVKEHMEKKPCN